MKSIIPLSAFTLLAALAFAGCSPSNSPETPPANSTMTGTNDMMSRTNMTIPATTNSPAASDATR